MSQSGSATETFVEYKRGPVSGQEEYLDPETVCVQSALVYTPHSSRLVLVPFSL